MPEGAAVNTKIEILNDIDLDATLRFGSRDMTLEEVL